MGNKTKQANRGQAIINMREQVSKLAKLISGFAKESKEQDKTTNERLDGFSKVLDDHADQLQAITDRIDKMELDGEKFADLICDVDKKHEQAGSHTQTQHNRLLGTRIMRFLLFFSKYGD